MEESNIKHIMGKLHKLKCSSRWLRGTTCSSNWLSCIMKVSQVEYIIFKSPKKKKKKKLPKKAWFSSCRFNTFQEKTWSGSVLSVLFQVFDLILPELLCPFKNCTGKACESSWSGQWESLQCYIGNGKASRFHHLFLVLVLAPFPSAINKGNLC